MSAAEPHLALDPDQYAAVHAPAGPLLIVAGPGSGKTRVLVHRVARLVAGGADPSSIVLLTFTQKAARQMVARLASLLGPGARSIWAGTFHALCAQILRAHGDRIGLRRDFGLVDPAGAVEVLDEVIAAAGLPADSLPPGRTILRLLSLSLNADLPLPAAIDKMGPRWAGQAATLDALCGAYCGRKLELNLLDYDDLLVFAELLLAEDAALGDAMARRCRHVLVDEYQDTNPVQARLVARLAGHHGDLCAVGDDAQAIYGFRGADVGHMLGFEGRWPGARAVRLGRNHRSTAPIVALSNACLGHLRRGLEKSLVSAVGEGPKPGLVRPDDPVAEARFIIRQALTLRAAGVPLEEQAALYRAHAHARALQLELGRQGVPFTVRGGPRVFDQAHVRDVLAFLRVGANPLDQPAWRRVFRLAPGVGPVAAEHILGALFAGGDPWSALAADAAADGLRGRARAGYDRTRQTLLALVGPELAGRPGPMVARILTGGYAEHLERAFPEDHDRRLDDLWALSAHAEGHDAASLLEELALADRLDGASAGLTLSTIHQAKGLEWHAVFVMALAEGWFPARLDGDLDEERRLFYVASTRARRFLYLCSPVGDGEGGMARRLSRFVAEITDREPTLVERWPNSDD